MYKRNTMRTRVLAIAAASACFGPVAPSAFAQQQAYTTEVVDVFSGPSGDYPVVSQLGPNVPVTVMGCVSDYSWCDVALPDLRGWVYADYLAYPYQGSYVPVYGYGAAIGFPIVTFALGAYWDSFYRGRPWYGDRDRWAHVPPPRFGERPPGRPPMHGGQPPAYGAPQPGMGYRPSPSAGGPRPEPRMPVPQGEGGRPPAPAPMTNVPRQPAPAPAATRPAAPPPQYGGRPSEPPAGAYGRGAYGQPGGQRAPAPAPAPGAERPQGQPQGGHPSSQGNSGRNDNRQQY
ncbi:SH3 domain-containing protein [Paraburkholderia adhaesiva]|uniref:SH3 domain-containing protein n=1 Tax=Paraburkholderia adhaesiva TaxID=2883244 RepID=UPI00227969BE|nr:SH3 domain-containing protein [Paraburkholderia adhaesiva]